MALAWFWGQYPLGQWVVLILIFSLVISAIGALEMVAQGEGIESWRAFAIGPIVTVAFFIFITVLRRIVALTVWAQFGFTHHFPP